MASFKRFLFLLTLSLSLAAAGFFIFEPRVIEIKNAAAPQPTVKAATSVKLIFVGDIMLDRGVKYKVEKEAGGDFRFPFLKIADVIRGADLSFGNLESQISDQGKKVGSIYSFRAPLKAIEGLKFAGFDVLSLANNHSFDYTGLALQDSRDRLIQAGISPLGAGKEAQAFSPVIKNVKGIRIAFFAYTDQGPEAWLAKDETFGVAQASGRNLERIKTDISLAKELADVVVVSLHAGDEYGQELTSSQISLSKAFIDAGADLVVGHHAHVVQKSQDYKGKNIFYSLGNFIFDQSFSEKTMEGQLVEVLIEGNKIKNAVAKKIKINGSFQPELAE